MRSGKYVITIIFSLILLCGVFPVHVKALSADQVINEYPKLLTVGTNNIYADRVRSLVAQLVADNKHRDYPGIILAEDINKWMFYKGMEVATLSQLVPTISEPTATGFKNFLKYEVSNYLLNKTYTDFEKQGDLKPKISFLNWSATWWQWKSVEYEGVYGLWAYAHYTNDWDTIKNNWSKVKALFDSGSNIGKANKKFLNNGYYRDPNAEIAGRIAYARMAKKLYSLTNDSSYQTIYQGQLSSISSLLSGLGSYIGKGVYENQICDFDSTKICVLGSDLSSRDMLPNLSQFDFLTPEIARWDQANYSTQVNTLLSSVQQSNPYWYLASYNLEGAGGEGYFQSPLLAYQIYQADALILNKPVLDLQKYLPLGTETATVPADWDILSYANYGTLIGRMEGIVWTDTNTAPPSLGGGSTAQCNTDLNLDGITDLEDYSALANDFFSTSPSNPRADINKDGIVDLTDYSFMSAKFFSTCP